MNNSSAQNVHSPIWRWRFPAHTMPPSIDRPDNNPWRYVDAPPTHPSYVGTNPYVEVEPVTAHLIQEALDAAYIQGGSDEKFDGQGATRRKGKRWLNQHAARRRRQRRGKK